MAMVDWHLLPNEIKIHESKLSWKVFWKKYLVSLILLFGGIYTYLFLENAYKLMLSISMVFAGLVIFQLTNFQRGKERVLLTTERIIIRKVGGGLIHDVEAKRIDMEQIRLSEIVNISVKQKSFVERRLLNLGDIVIKVRSGDEYKILRIDNPYELERAIYHLLEREKKEGLLEEKR